MKKITNLVLWLVGLSGTYLVTEGIITGEELGDIQNVIGMVLGGGALSIGMIMSILSAIPKQLITAGYDKAVEKYGQGAVDNVFAKFDEFMDLLHTVDTKLDNVQSSLDKAEEVRENLLKEA